MQPGRQAYAAAAMVAVLGAATPASTAPERYDVVALRAASGVAAPAQPVPVPGSPSRVVGAAEMGPRLTWHDGRTCNDWTQRMLPAPPLDVGDAMLSDLQVWPLRSWPGAEDHRLNQGMQILCRGTPFAAYVRIDPRVIVAPTPDGATHIILQRAPSSEEAARVLDALAAQGFVADAADSEGLGRGLAEYAHLHGAAYRFESSPLTVNVQAALVSDDGVSPAIRTFVDRLLAEEKRALAEQGFNVEVDAVVDLVDLGGDGLADLVVRYTTPSHCGTGGCEVFVFEAIAASVTPDGATAWRRVYRYTGGPYTLADSRTAGYRDIRRPAYLAGDDTVVEVATWQGETYAVTRYEAGRVDMTPVNGTYRATRTAAIHNRPAPGEPTAGELVEKATVRPMAVTTDGAWYLVLVATGVAGYVPSDALEPAQP